MLSVLEKTVILPFLLTMISMAARNELRFRKLASTVTDKTVDGSMKYWSNVVSAYRQAYYIAGGDRDSIDSLISRIKDEIYAEGKSV